MIDSEGDIGTKLNFGDQNLFLQEYSNVVENLKEDLNICKAEQNNIRSQLETLQNDSKGASDVIQDYFSRVHLETCGQKGSHETEMITNLQDRITILQTERDSVIQLWQIALKAIDALEEELKAYKTDNKGTKLYEAQINSVKETYSEAIRALETKLLQAKDNFLKQQSSWEASKEKIENLNKEKEELTQKLTNLQKDNWEKDRSNQLKIESLRKELTHAKAEIHKIICLKTELEQKLTDTKKFATNIMAKDEETKCKMAEALELVESAIREKDLILQRESHILEDKCKLEQRLSMLSEEYTKKWQEEIKLIKDAHEHDIKKYLLEIKELKAELRQKATLLDRAQRECKLAEEELTKVQLSSEDMLQRSNLKISDLEEKLKHTEFQLQSVMSKKKDDSEFKHLWDKVTDLENKLSSNKKYIKIHHIPDDTDGQLKQVNEKTKETIQQYADLEIRLNKALNEKENLAREFASLQSSFDREIQKREYDRDILQHKIHDLEENLHKATHAAEETLRNNLFSRQLFSLEQEIKKTHGISNIVDNKEHCCQGLLAEQINRIQERYDKKIKELSQHVETHQALSKRWQDEAKLLASKFQGKAKELRIKINTLQRENEELNKELLMCRQQLAQYRVQVVHRYNEGAEPR